MAANQIVELNDLYALINRAMQESAMTQGKVGDDLSKGLSGASKLLEGLNNSAASIQEKIQAIVDQMGATNGWMIAFFVIAGVAAFAAPVLGGMAATAATVVASFAGVAGGAASITEGVFNIELAHQNQDLAPKNGTIAGLNGAQQTYQGAGKWTTNQMGETFSRMGDMARTITEGQKKISEGIRMSGQDAVRGVLHSRS